MKELICYILCVRKFDFMELKSFVMYLSNSHVHFKQHYCHFSGVPDPWYLVRIRLRLFSSVTFKTVTKFFSKFFCILLFEGTLHHSPKIKSIKKSQNSRYQGFSYYFCLVMEGSGSGSGFVHTHSFSGNLTASSRNLTATSLGNLTAFYKEISRPESNLTATPQQSHRCFGQSHAHYQYK
jgi:hypothetical protein